MRRPTSVRGRPAAAVVSRSAPCAGFASRASLMAATTDAAGGSWLYRRRPSLWLIHPALPGSLLSLHSEVNTLTATTRDFKKQIQVLQTGLEGQGAMITAPQKRARPEDDEEVINDANCAAGGVACGARRSHSSELGGVGDSPGYGGSSLPPPSTALSAIVPAISD